MVGKRNIFASQHSQHFFVVGLRDVMAVLHPAGCSFLGFNLSVNLHSTTMGKTNLKIWRAVKKTAVVEFERNPWNSSVKLEV